MATPLSLAHFNRGNILSALEQFEAALASYDAAIANDADYAEAYCNRGLALAELGQLDAALISFEQAIAIKPDLAEAHSNRGNALMTLNQWKAALASFDRAIALRAGYNEAHYNRGNALLALEHPAAALASYDTAIAIHPEHAQAWCNRGLAQSKLKDWTAAQASFERAIAIKPDFAEAHCNCGNALTALEQWQAALASYDRAIEIDADLAEAHSNRGNVLTALDQWEAALASYQRAVALKADFADAHFNHSCLLLLRGNFADGWAEYEWRRKGERLRAATSSVRQFSQPLWLGEESLAGKTILLHAEQGLGDTIQFCRYAPWVAALGARVILAVPRPLVRLLASLQGASQVIAQDSASPDFDYQCPLLSLPLAFKTRLDTIPQPTPYLSIPEDAIEHWQRKLGAKTGLRVGLVWSGNRAHKNDHHRSIALAELIADLPPQCEFISLQKDVSEADLRTLQSNPQIVNVAHELDDFRDSAALCACMDVVISVDTSMAHLSAALGKSTWILLPRYPDWRWLLNRSDSPWYSTVTLYRQARAGDWRDVLQRVHADLLETGSRTARSNPPTRSPKRRPNPMMPERANSGSLPPPGHALIASTLRDALALHQRGQLVQAQAKYQELLELQPAHVDALNLLSVIALQTGNHASALNLLGRAIELDPGNAAFHFNRGTVLQALHKPDEALSSYDRALEIKSDYAESHCNRGLVLAQLKRWDAALASYDRAVAIKPEFAQAHFNRGIVLEKLERWEQALSSYERAVSLEPGFAEGYCNRGLVLAQLDRWDAALASYDAAIAIKPIFAEAHFNRGLVLSKLEQPGPALASFDRAIELKADFAEAYYNRGLVLAQLKQVAASLSSYDRALELKPGYAQAHQNRSWMLLLSGDLARGWIDYEWRWKDTNGANIQHMRTFGRPLWLGDTSIAGKTILLHAEQGLGDTLQFCRYVKRVADLGASVILEIPPPLAALLENLEGVSILITHGRALPDFDCHCPLLSLPLAFKTTLDSIPGSPNYLSADPAKIAQWRGMLGNPRAPRVGLAWRGSTLHKNDHNRSIPLAEIVEHLPAGFEYVSLQKELQEADRLVLESHPHIVNQVDALNDFGDTAALCACMDVVICVDTSVAHLAGALGKRTWILLPHHPDWRWLQDREDSPWYPSVTLYRQADAGDWQGVLGRIHADLVRWRETTDGANR
jgi:tetratricopeptide (TPR) repeat protein/ADP-heptose:LPS heptosyltransferase